MKALSDFRQYAHIRLCPLPLVEEAIRQAAIEFSQMSAVLRETLAPINVVADTVTYTLVSAETDQRPLFITYIAYDGDPINVITPEAADALSDEWRDPGYGTPNFCVQFARNTLTLGSKPEAGIAGGLKVSIAVYPKETATTMHDELLDNWGQHIGHGALARLYLMPNEPWSNPELATFHLGQFRIGIHSAKIEANRSAGAAPLRVRMRPLA